MTYDPNSNVERTPFDVSTRAFDLFPWAFPRLVRVRDREPTAGRPAGSSHEHSLPAECLDQSGQKRRGPVGSPQHLGGLTAGHQPGVLDRDGQSGSLSDLATRLLVALALGARRAPDAPPLALPYSRLPAFRIFRTPFTSTSTVSLCEPIRCGRSTEKETVEGVGYGERKKGKRLRVEQTARDQWEPGTGGRSNA